MNEIPRWAWMWGLAAAVFAACKAFTWTRNRAGAFGGRDAAYLFLWPGMDAKAFLDRNRRPAPPPAPEWFFAAAKTAFGVALVWIVAPRAAPPLLKGWIGLLGMIFILHFGTFLLTSVSCRRA